MSDTGQGSSLDSFHYEDYLPYINSKFIYPTMVLATFGIFGFLQSRGFVEIITFDDFQKVDIRDGGASGREVVLR